MAALPEPRVDGAFESYSRTTYRDTYRPSRTLPPIKFSQPPSFEIHGAKHVQNREFPLIPSGPKRPLLIERPVAVGVGTKHVNTERYLDPKPIIKTQPPNTIVHAPVALLKKRRGSAKRPKVPAKPMDDEQLISMDGDVINSLCKHATWNTTTQKANNEATVPAVPVEPPWSTYEQNADMVKLHPRRYEKTANTWQSVASVWERTQSRPHTETWRSDNFIVGSKPGGHRRMQRRPNVMNRIYLDDKINNLVKQNKLSSTYDRHCPGYAGFVPRSPTNTPVEATDQSNHTTIMKSSYREFPTEEYRVKKYAHNGPLSQLVTLTSPYNPFNKFQSQEQI